MTENSLEIIYRDNGLVAINKPPGLLVHRTNIARDAQTFAVQQLRDQIGQYVHPIHRLDRKTSGVLLFGLNKEVHSAMQQQFAHGLVQKKYLAIVRGFTAREGCIDHPIQKENGVLQGAVTKFTTLDRSELPIAFGEHLTSRYSLVEIMPLNGRKHQIRKHFAHIRHPIIADRPHGCTKQNKLFKDKFGLMTMMLHAGELQFSHPISKEQIVIEANLHMEFKKMIDVLGFQLPTDPIA